MATKKKTVNPDGQFSTMSVANLVEILERYPQNAVVDLAMFDPNGAPYGTSAFLRVDLESSGPEGPRVIVNGPVDEDRVGQV